MYGVNQEVSIKVLNPEQLIGAQLSLGAVWEDTEGEELSKTAVHHSGVTIEELDNRAGHTSQDTCALIAISAQA